MVLQDLLSFLQTTFSLFLGLGQFAEQAPDVISSGSHGYVPQPLLQPEIQQRQGDAIAKLRSIDQPLLLQAVEGSLQDRRPETADAF
jgi:hypothetical protein